MVKKQDSSYIFNDIPKLPDPEIEIERQNIVNYCFLFDTELENLSFIQIERF